jgi:hypothetical protein
MDRILVIGVARTAEPACQWRALYSLTSSCAQ